MRAGISLCDFSSSYNKFKVFRTWCLQAKAQWRVHRSKAVIILKAQTDTSQMLDVNHKRQQEGKGVGKI